MIWLLTTEVLYGLQQEARGYWHGATLQFACLEPDPLNHTLDRASRKQ